MAKRSGRPKLLGEEEVALLESLYFKEGMSVREVADALHVSHMTVWRALCQLPSPAGLEGMRF